MSAGYWQAMANNGDRSEDRQMEHAAGRNATELPTGNPANSRRLSIERLNRNEVVDAAPRW